MEKAQLQLEYSFSQRCYSAEMSAGTQRRAQQQSLVKMRVNRGALTPAETSQAAYLSIKPYWQVSQQTNQATTSGSNTGLPET